MVPCHALAVAMASHTVPGGLSMAACRAVLGASWQLSAQAAAALQQCSGRMYSSASINSIPQQHLNALNTSSSHATGSTAPTQGAAASERQFSSSQAVTASSSASSSSASSSTQHNSSTAEAEESIEVIRARVFEHHVGNNKRSGRRPLLKALRGDWVANWYFLPDPNLPMLENFNEADRLERVGLRKAAGKAPPKKGQGKRAGGKKR